jgi:putative two-component system response regulator
MKILIAEDDATSRTMLQAMLGKWGYEVVAANNGDDAWKQLQASDAPLLAIVDWMMPGLDGLELCRRLRATDKDDYTYVIMVTGRNEKADLITGFEAGVDDYLVKPIDLNELFLRLKSAERVLSLQGKDTVIFAMAKLTEARDPETGLHLERIRNYCRTIAVVMLRRPDRPRELNHHFIRNLYLTSPLHDIGKVGMPDHILLKPARLDDQEFALMKKHTLIGYDTLKSAWDMNPHAAYLKMAAEIARFHHEKWDGSGYPDGLKGEDIPLSARIVALADVYDALVTQRVYKSAFSHETARSIILEGQGKHFDPKVVEAFLESEAEFLTIREAHTQE